MGSNNPIKLSFLFELILVIVDSLSFILVPLPGTKIIVFGAFTNDVIILGGGGLENMTQDVGGGGVGLKMTLLFQYDFGKNCKQF